MLFYVQQAKRPAEFKLQEPEVKGGRQDEPYYSYYNRIQLHVLSNANLPGIGYGRGVRLCIRALRINNKIA